MKLLSNLILLIGMSVSCVSGLNAQDTKTVLASTQAVYRDAGQLEYSCRYELFSGYTGTDLLEAYDGYFYRSEEGQYQKIGAAEYIFGQDFFLLAEHAEKTIAVFDAQKNAGLQTDLEAFLKLCTSSDMQDNGKTYTVRMKLNAAATTAISEMVLIIDKKDYHLLRMELYYANTGEITEKGVTDPPHRLEITFKEFTLKPKQQKELLKLSTYVQTGENGIAAQDFYTGYTVKDNRLN
jgi:hypothetical protein